MSDLFTKINKMASTKEAIRIAINTLNASEVLNTEAEFDIYPDYLGPKTYTVRIDLNNSDPETACIYMDDAVGMTPGYDGWKDKPIIKSIKPCVLGSDGTVKYYLQKDDYTKKEDGSTSVLTGTDGDVMVEIPKMGYRLWNDDSYQYVSVTTELNKENYCYYAHSLNSDGDCSHIYIGAYLGYVDNKNLYSRSGVSPTASTTLSTFRTYSSNRGTRYSLISFYPWTLLQCLYTVIYKNLDSQAALGQGYTDANTKGNTGATNSNTFCYGTQDRKTHIKFLGIEDFYGNLYSYLDGIYSDFPNLLTDYKNSQMTDKEHDFQISAPLNGFRSNISGNMKSIQGTNTTGFVLKSTDNNNSYNTFFSDNSGVNTYGYFCNHGGSWSSDVSGGVFALRLSSSASGISSNNGSRLMYKHLKEA